MNKKLLSLFVCLFITALKKFGKKTVVELPNGKKETRYSTVLFGDKYQQILSAVKGEHMPHTLYNEYLTAAIENGLVFKSFARGEKGRAFPIVSDKPMPKKESSKKAKEQFDMAAYLTSRVKK